MTIGVYFEVHARGGGWVVSSMFGVNEMILVGRHQCLWSGNTMCVAKLTARVFVHQHQPKIAYQHEYMEYRVQH